MGDDAPGRTADDQDQRGQGVTNRVTLRDHDCGCSAEAAEAI